MPGEAHLIVASGAALGATFAATPAAIQLATRTGFHDKPFGYKGHASPTPYLGGLAVLFGFLLAALTIGEDLSRLSPIVVGAVALWGLGTLDDRRSLGPGFRLAVEAAVAAGLWVAGVGWDVFGADALDLLLSVVWLLAIVNAFNFMDNLDGAAATVGALAAAAVAVLALIAGDPALAVVCGGLAGACLGFLPYNLAGPARIFLGDGGSLPIGFVVAASLMALSGGDGAGWELLLAAVLLVGTPVVDTALVLISRRRAGVPMLSGGRDHLTHRLLSRLGSPRRVALALGAAQTVLGAVAIGVFELGEGPVIAVWILWFLAAAAAVTLLESRAWAPTRDWEPAPETSAGAPHPTPSRWPSLVEGLLIAFIALAFGLSPFFYGFYDLSVWAPIALGVMAGVVGFALARPARPRPAALVALAGLVALVAWSFLSAGWAESSSQALTEGNRWLLYAALFALLVLLLRDDRLGAIVIAAASAAVLGLGLYLVARMAAGDGATLFQGSRLGEPLGYVNGQAGYLLLGIWPLVAVAERFERSAASGAALAGAVLLAGLAVLSQSRAVIPAVVLSALLLLIAVPGRARRLWALLAVGAGLAAALSPLLDVYESPDTLPSDAVVQDAATALLVAALLTGLVWAGATWLATRLRGSLAARRLGVALPFAMLAAGLVVALAAIDDPAGRVDREYRAFTELRPNTAQSTRFTSGAGNRYDYWRVAKRQFDSEPFHGVGAGNYDLTYFQERRTAENVRQPHSIELQTLAELGVVGGAALALFLGGVLAGFVRRVLRSRDSRERALTVAAGGLFITWLVHTSVDWLHLIPGVTGIALFAAAVLVGPWREPGAARPRARAVLAGCCVALVLAGAVLMGRAALADHYRSAARDRVASDPVEAVRKADDSLSFDGQSLDTYYVKAAAYARLNGYAPARDSLREAARLEPHDFLPWALLGDLATRRGDRAAARRYYRRALRLNPRDPELRRLSRR